MAGLGGGRAAREREVSATELEVARILAALPQLVWEADHGPPCTHNHRWGAKKRRSACADDEDDTPQPPLALPPAPAPAPPPSAAPEKLRKKRSREAAEAAQVPLRKDGRHGARQGPAEKHPEEAGAVEAAAAMGTSSPGTPLDFYPSAEEPDARARACPPDAGRLPAKKRRLKHEHLSKQVDQLNGTRTELQKEAEEIRNRLEALRVRNSKLVELRIKLEAERKQQRPRDCVDLFPAGPARPASAAHAPDRVLPQAQPPLPQRQYQQSWPQHWVNNNRVMFHQVAPGFSLHSESQGWSWAGAQAGRADGDGAGNGTVMDVNSGAGLVLASEYQQQQQQQQNNYYYHQQQEQKAARKKRIQMMQQRRNAAGAAAAGGTSVKVASFR